MCQTLIHSIFIDTLYVYVLVARQKADFLYKFK